ncbi:MAG TPA: glycosyltransferase [Pyrinomonadaceae bacterium]|nr:glycosyltransferase [Pyrinomonadaceae bacterium]
MVVSQIERSTDLPVAGHRAGEDLLARRNGNEPLKIVHIISDLVVGGAEMNLYRLLSGIDLARYQTTVVTLRDGGELRERIKALGVEVYSLGMRPPAPSPGSLVRLIRLMRRLDPDLIQGWMYYGNLAAQFAAPLLSRRPVTVWGVRQSIYSLTREKPMTALAIWLSARLSKRPAAIIYNSTKGAVQHESIGYEGGKSRIIYNGFDLEAFAPSQKARLSVRAELGLPPDAMVIGLIGRYHPAKDHANFLSAAAILAKDHPEIHFVLSGRGVHRENRTLGAVMKPLGFNGNVHLLGERKDVARLMASFDISVSSSAREGFPNVVGEAMACGVPCVVTDVGDSAKLVGSTGLIVPPRNPEALAQAWRELVAMGASSRTQLGHAARERIRDNFQLPSIIGQYEELFTSVLQKRRKHLHLCDS